MPLVPGSRAGSYEIVAPIGAGGMGEVYRAHDTKLKRDVALKVLPDSFASDPDRMARFQREAEVLASLNHPNIAAIYGIEDRALVMELVEGEELKGPLPIETAVNYASQIALALAAAHEKGIVHRDLKPANIKITPDGVVKVLDFGLAAVATDSSGADQQNSPTLTIRATQAGFIMGTAGYMSPEQAAGKPVDRRADIWSFGVVLCEMLTGKRLFDGETVSHTLAAVLTKDPDWNQLPAGTPANVRRLLRRCLERDLKRRLHDMGDAWLELNSPDEVPPPDTIKPSGFARWLSWAIGALLAAGGIGWGLFHSPKQLPQPVVHSSFTEQNPFGMPALSRDGTRLAYGEFTNGTTRLMLRMLDQLEAQPLAGTESGGVPTFSPDGQSLAYTSGFSTQVQGTKLQKIALNGGASPITICDCPASWGLNWGDDHNIVFSDGKKLMRVSDSGGAPQVLITANSKKGEAEYMYPSFLPGMSRVLFAIRAGETSQVAVLDLKKGEYHGIGVFGTNPQYVSAGYLTYVRGGTMFAIPFNAKRVVVTGSETAVINGTGALFGGENAADYSVSANGIVAYMAGESMGSTTVLSWVDRKGVIEPISEPRHWGDGRLSPDGLRIANTLANDVWTLDVARRTLTRLTFGGTNTDPVWTPDGRRLAYYSIGAGTSGIYWVAADGSGKPELLAPTESRIAPSSWTPDGRTLVFTQAGTDKLAHVWLLPVTGDRKPVLWHDSPTAESGAQVSPDGRYLAYVSRESGTDEVYVQPFPGPGAKTRISTQGGGAPRWSRNGRELFYWAMSNTVLMAVDVDPGAVFRAGLPHEVLKTFSGTTWDVAPDGKRFLIESLNMSKLRMDVVVNWFDELRQRAPLK